MDNRPSIRPVRMKNLSQQFEEVRLVYSNKIKASDRPRIDSPEKAYQTLKELWDDEQIALVEEAKMLLLDNALGLMCYSNLSKGGTTCTIVDPKIVFATALKRRASKIILAHNHPSGLLKPSRQDIHISKKLAEAGATLDLPVLDHIIITDEGYYSMKSEGEMSDSVLLKAELY
ncbi:MAG: JAB domain-containing protein [Cytophagales bacterium]